MEINKIFQVVKFLLLLHMQLILFTEIQFTLALCALCGGGHCLQNKARTKLVPNHCQTYVNHLCHLLGLVLDLRSASSCLQFL